MTTDASISQIAHDLLYGYAIKSADVRVLLSEYRRARAVVDKLVYAGRAMLEPCDPECELDHHGACQAHNLRQVQGVDGSWEYECQVPLMRAAIEAAEARAGDDDRREGLRPADPAEGVKA